MLGQGGAVGCGTGTDQLLEGLQLPKLRWLGQLPILQMESLGCTCGQGKLSQTPMFCASREQAATGYIHKHFQGLDQKVD